MSKAFFIDYVRQLIIQTLEQEHIKNPNLVGGDNQVNLFSFYEQLVNQDEVDRYVEMYRQLTDQQNRIGLIANGIIASPENPTITNLNKSTIVPLSFTCAFRLTLEDRDLMLETIDNLISIHKGRKVDIAQFDNGKLFMVGTMGNNVEGVPLVRIGDFIGTKQAIDNQTVNQFVSSRLTTLNSQPYNFNISELLLSTRTRYVYFGENNLLKVAIYNNATQEWEEKVDDNSYDDVLFPPQHTSFTKYKVSISFDAMRVNEPRTLNGKEFIEISFGGNATIVNNGVKLGNDLTKLSIQKNKLITKDGAVNLNNVVHWLEPLEMPSGNNADTQLNRLMSNNFVTNTHTDSITISNRYTFICDDELLVEQWYNYARYGEQSNGLQTTITPNIIYKINEYYISWGAIKKKEYLAKIVESIDIDNNENDVLTISVPFQVQGENN